MRERGCLCAKSEVFSFEYSFKSLIFAGWTFCNLKHVIPSRHSINPPLSNDPSTDLTNKQRQWKWSRKSNHRKSNRQWTRTRIMEKRGTAISIFCRVVNTLFFKWLQNIHPRHVWQCYSRVVQLPPTSSSLIHQQQFQPTIYNNQMLKLKR